jgi:PKHD-type hydroxylase
VIVCLAEVLPAPEIARVVHALGRVEFGEGAATAGWHAREVKRNEQAQSGIETAELQRSVEKALRRNPVFALAARPRRIAPLLFSRYEPGMTYGEHVDDAIMGGDHPMRTDIACTLFLSAPESYEGGELVVDSPGGEQSFKLPAGAAVLYPASSLHRVEPVTAGRRLAAVTWVQSLVRDPAQRELLFELDSARRALFAREGKSREFDLVSKSVANLLRMWSEV